MCRYACARYVRVYRFFSSCHFCIGASLYNGEIVMDKSNCRSSNEELLNTLRQSDDCNELHAIAVDDWKKHRMSEPQRASEVNLDEVLF